MIQVLKLRTRRGADGWKINDNGSLMSLAPFHSAFTHTASLLSQPGINCKWSLCELCAVVSHEQEEKHDGGLSLRS